MPTGRAVRRGAAATGLFGAPEARWPRHAIGRPGRAQPCGRPSRRSGDVAHRAYSRVASRCTRARGNRLRVREAQTQGRPHRRQGLINKASSARRYEGAREDTRLARSTRQPERPVSDPRTRSSRPERVPSPRRGGCGPGGGVAVARVAAGRPAAVPAVAAVARPGGGRSGGAPRSRVSRPALRPATRSPARTDRAASRPRNARGSARRGPSRTRRRGPEAAAPETLLACGG